VGWVFFYAGVEKLLGVGLEAGKTWSAAGFLKFATAGTWPGAAPDAVINPTPPSRSSPSRSRRA
jgi:uncharacterized membrane protein YphA (DoxX/SURF4 family)